MISLHTLQLQLGGGIHGYSKLWPTFHFWGLLGYSKLKVPSSGPLFIFREWLFLATQIPKSWPTFHFLGGMGILDYSKLKVPSSGQLFIFREGVAILGYSKLKVSSSGQLFIFRERLFMATQNSKSQVLVR